MSQPTTYDQGHASGKRYALDTRRKMRLAVDRETKSKAYDLLALAAEDVPVLPDDLVAQIDERVPNEARPKFCEGFRDGVRDFLNDQYFGTSNN